MLFQLIWVTVFVSIPVLAWMGFFLTIWPSWMKRSGLLDLYHNQMQTQDSNPGEAD